MFYGTYVAVKIIFITLFYLVGGRKKQYSRFECVIGYYVFHMCVISSCLRVSRRRASAHTRTQQTQGETMYYPHDIE